MEVHFLTPIAVTYLKAPVVSLEQESLSFLLSVYFFTRVTRVSDWLPNIRIERQNCFRNNYSYRMNS